MNIRECNAADIDSTAEIFCHVYTAAPYNEVWDLAHASSYLRRFWEIDPAGCFVAEREGKAIGAIFSFSYPWHSGKLTCIQELFVTDHMRHQGVARSLIQSLNGGAGGVAWLVAHKASGAAEFYKRMGFRQDSPYEFHYGSIPTPE